MDLDSDGRAWVVALLAGAAQTMSIDTLGDEPNVTLPKIEENVAAHFLLGNGKALSISKRRKLLGCHKRAAAYEFDTEKVYTFHE